MNITFPTVWEQFNYGVFMAKKAKSAGEPCRFLESVRNGFHDFRLKNIN